MVKKFIKILIVLVFVVTCFAGCARVEQFFVVTPKGEIQSGVNIDINKDEINKAHENGLITGDKTPDSAELMDFVLTQMYLQKLRIEQVFNSIDKHLRPNYTISITSHNEDYTKIDLKKLKTISNAKILISFSTYEDFLKGQALLNPPEQNPDKDSGKDYWTKTLFTYTHHIYSNSTFKANLSPETELVEVLKNAYSSFNIEKDVRFVQVYATQDAKLRSNATNTQSRQGVYYHLWDYNSEQVLTPNAIKLFYVYPNAQGWYILTLVLLMFFAFFYVLFVLYKKPLKPKVKKQKSKSN